MGIDIIKTQIRNKIENVLLFLYEYDSYLIENNLHERAITHRIGSYLIKEFPQWDVDVEYNRVGNDPKKIHEIESLIYEEIYKKGLQDHFNNNMNVLPDIIVHKRGTKHNLIALELKKWYSSVEEDEIDRIKLKCYLKEKSLEYNYAVFIKLLKDRKHILEVYSIEELNFG
ncbi:hypothetical protein [Paenibacillus sp. sgz500958]|uniref:hypothetical protein n=1 Tax=Paenibacillus sp. sgz500958 TaxID=3242475 RepID=UPI0036D43A51